MKAPYQLVSLAEIMELPIAKLLEKWDNICVFSQLLAMNIQNKDIHMPSQNIKTFREIFRVFAATCKEIGLSVTTEMAEDLHKNFKGFQVKGKFTYINQVKMRVILSHVDSIRRALKSETSVKVAVIIPTEMTPFYNPKEPLFGNDVKNKFPSVIFELNEAGKCMALGRSTAAVFHLMRLMEIALRAVGTCLNVQAPASQNWFEWLKLIREERLRRNNQNSKSNWAESDFFQDVWQRLDSIKDAQRNSTMHVEAIYTPEEAKEIFDLTRGFMKKIASRMDEKGEPFA